MSATVFEKNGNALTVKPSGRLDTTTSPVFQNELMQHLGGIMDLTVDFANVVYISSGGLRVLLTVQQEMDSREGEMRLIHVSAQILSIFELVGFSDIVTIIPD